MTDVELVSRIEAPRVRGGGSSVPWRLIGVLLVTAVTVVVALVLTGGRPRSASAGLPDAGVVTGWSLPLARAAMDLGLIGTVGSLLAATFLVPSVDGQLGATGRKAMRVAGWWAGAWAGSAAALFTLSTADVLGVPLATVLRSSALHRYGGQLPEGRALIAVALAAFAVALFARTIRSQLGGVLLLLLATIAVAPLLLTGHSAAAVDHYLGTQSLLVHVLAATLWVGGLLGLVLLVRGDRDALPVAVPRFSRLALVCFVLVAVSGAVGAWSRLGLGWDSWLSTYGALLAAKTLALLTLGFIGLLHRRHTVARVVAGSSRAFTRLAVVEVLLMSATVGVAVVLSRTAPPAGRGLAADSSHAGTLGTVDPNIDPISLTQMFTQWRPDALVVTAVVVAAAGYLLAVRRVRSDGIVWPAARVGCAMAGLGVVLFALCGGLAAYSSALLSGQVAQFLTMLIIAPMLITLGAPVQLVRAASGFADSGRTSPVVRRLADPVNGLSALLLLVIVVYATPVLDASLRSPAVHLLVNVLALGVGLLAFWSVLARDWCPVTRTTGDRAGVVRVLAVVLGFFAVIVWWSDPGYGAAWFDELNLWWARPTLDRGAAALVVGVFAGALVGLARGMERGLGRGKMESAECAQSPRS